MRYIECLGKWSWLVLALMMAMVTAQYASGKDRSGELQRLVKLINDQLPLVEPFDSERAEARRDRLGAALQAWSDSRRGDAEFAIMQAWLREALRTTMPGSRETMPRVPVFPTVPAPQPVEVIAPEVTNASELPEPVQAEVSESVVSTQARPQPEAEMPPAPPREELWKQHPAVRPIEVSTSDPFIDDPEPLVVVPRKTLRPTTFASAAGPAVNVDELKARILGYHQGMRSVESRLIAAEELESAQLLRLARELRQLNAQRAMVTMYVDLLDATDRAGLPELGRADLAKRALTAEIERREAAAKQLPDASLLPASDTTLDETSKLLESL